LDKKRTKINDRVVLNPEAIEWTMEQTALLHTVFFFSSLFTLFDLRRVPSVAVKATSYVRYAFGESHYM